MRELFKKYWDIVGGFSTGILLSIIAKFQLQQVQLIYSVIILILVSIGVFKIVKQTVDKNKTKRKTRQRKDNLIDALVDGQKPVKAVSLATEPTKEGEKLGHLIMDIGKGSKKIMKKIKVFFEKFKGYILALALGVLTIVEYYGAFINDIFNGALTVNGVDILPIITLVCAIIVGIISNGYSKEQITKIKALFSKSTTDELVISEIKKEIKNDELSLKNKEKELAIKETELDNLDAELTSAKNTHQAKQKMFSMVPQLASAEVVQEAANNVVNIEAKIVEKKAELETIKATITNLNKTIAALKNQIN